MPGVEQGAVGIAKSICGELITESPQHRLTQFARVYLAHLGSASFEGHMPMLPGAFDCETLGNVRRVCEELRRLLS